MSRLIVALDWDGKYLKAANMQQVGLTDAEVIGGNIQTYLDPSEWAEMTEALRKGRSLKRLQQYNTPIGLTEQLVHWERSGRGKRQRLIGTVDELKLIKPAIVTQITATTDICTDPFMKIGHNGSNSFSVPEMHWTPESLRVAARNAFQRLPLLTHKEILERSVLEPTDKIRIYCESKDDAIALYEGRWDLAGCANLLYPQTEFELYIMSKDQPYLYKVFSEEEAALAGRAQRRELQTMIDGQIGNGHKKGLLLPQEWSFTEIFNSVMYSPDTMTLVTETESKPIIVSRQYAELTKKTVSYWVGAGSINKAGWAPGELEKMQAYLERDGYLQNYEYKAYLHDFDEVTTWYTSFQRVFCDGEYMRVAKVLDIVKANLLTV